MPEIVTGPDKLLALLQTSGSLELGVAAKQLGVPVSLVQEWADFLEQEGMLSAKYGLLKSYLTPKRLTGQELVEKKKEFALHKDAFSKKVEVVMEQLVHEQENLRSIREKYGEIQALLGPGVDEIQDGIAELHHYHDLQHVIDVDAAKERTKLEQELTAIAERIHREEERYVAIEREIAAEQESLKSQSKEVDMLSEEERTLLTRIHAMQDTVKDVLVRMSSESKSIEMHRERLSSLQSLSKSLEQDISQRKKKEIAALEQVSKDQSARIKRLQEELLAKARARLTTAKEPAQVEARLKEFFEKREATAAALRTIEHDYQLAQDQLAALAVKARTLSVAGVDAQEHSKEITHQFDQLSKERENLAGEMQLLGKLVLGEVKATDAMT